MMNNEVTGSMEGSIAGPHDIIEDNKLPGEEFDEPVKNGEINGTNVIGTDENVIPPLLVEQEKNDMTYINSKEKEDILKLENTEDSNECSETTTAASDQPLENIETCNSNSNEIEDIPVGKFEELKRSKNIIFFNSEESQNFTDDDLKDSQDTEISIVNDTENSENAENVIEIIKAKMINNDSSQEDTINSNTEHSQSSDSGDNRTKTNIVEIFELMPDPEDSNNESENHTNSNASFTDSLTSLQGKLESTSHFPLNNLNENSSDLKSEDISQHLEDEADLDELSDADVSEEELKATDTVSANSDTEPEADILIPTNDESSQSDLPNCDQNEVTIENTTQKEHCNSDSQVASNLDVHEIESENEDCAEIKQRKFQTNEEQIPLRRSCRAIKRKRYTDDIENGDHFELEIENTQRHKTRPIVISNTKILVEMAAKNMRMNQGNKHKKEPTVVIIDTNSDTFTSCKNSQYTIHSNQNNHNMYMQRNREAISNKSNNVIINSAQSQSILPSLTDDMFVVEAPSFIVPYVYEKPSMKPFREFVDILGKELEEQRVKENNNKDNDNININEDEKVEESGDDDESGKNKKKEAKKKMRRRDNDDDDDASWDVESSSESEDDIMSEEEDTITKDKGYSMDANNSTPDLTSTRIPQSKIDNYFDCSLGKFFMDIGYNLVQEYVQHDLLKQQNRKLHRAKKSGHGIRATESSIASLKKNLELSKEKNASYAFKTQKCKLCSFTTESELIMAHHLETPHLKNNLYKCNFCSFEIRSPHDILMHMETVHNACGKIERSLSCHQCANCAFEDNGKGKLARHIISCMKKFIPESNLAPPYDWEPPAKIPKISKSRNSMMTSYHNAFNRGQIVYPMNRQMNIGNATPSVSSNYQPRGRTPNTIQPKPMSVQSLPIPRSGVIRQNTTIANSCNPMMKQKTVHQPSISITPLPRQPQPVLSQSSNTKSTFVICEICDGYIKDLEQLRNHMQSIHKVKIHPKMIYNRPPLNCQKCQFRFFTDQGLERHLLGTHGLVTNSMQEAANKCKDSGRCPVCGRVYQWKLLNHVARDHNLPLRPAHLSYKCTVCTATFGMYKQFENHVYSAHSIVAKRVMETNKTIPQQNKSSLLKPLKINDEITIIPHSMKSVMAKEK